MLSFATPTQGRKTEGKATEADAAVAAKTAHHKLGFSAGVAAMFKAAGSMMLRSTRIISSALTNSAVPARLLLSRAVASTYPFRSYTTAIATT